MARQMDTQNYIFIFRKITSSLGLRKDICFRNNLRLSLFRRISLDKQKTKPQALWCEAPQNRSNALTVTLVTE